jgi:carboxymethylenebutenolidase
MIERTVEIRTKDGVMRTFIAHRDERGPLPAVLLLMDAPGVREELRDMARRLASGGYFVLLPNLYYRRVLEFCYDRTTKSREEMYAHMASLSTSMAVEDCRAMLDYVTEEPVVTDGPVGVVGYCMSGPFAFAAAGLLPERVAAAASIHGVKLYSDLQDSPHRCAPFVKGELYFGCAEDDEFAPQQMIDDLNEYLKTVARLKYYIEIYPSTLHGFVFPSRSAFDSRSAARHWRRLFGLFGRNLRANAY